MAEGGRAAGRGRVVELAGGVGGAKLAEGLQAVVGDRLTVIVNTADDVERHGLLVMPDHDTVLYTLAGLENPDLGWGLAGETWAVMTALERLGEEAWFRLGDGDLATHIVRSARLRAGDRLTDVCRGIQQALGIAAAILPMSDDSIRTEVHTDGGEWLEFQEYFVHRRQEPTVLGVRFAGAEAATPSPEVLEALAAAEVIVVAPSNPIVSVGPILAVPGISEALGAARDRGVAIVAVSGIVGGRALKGPADRMLASLGHAPTAAGVAALYAEVATDFVLDDVDAGLAAEVEGLGLRAHVTDTIMTDDASRARLAGEILAAAGRGRG